ncbi:hypothetical protein X943_003871 [Babesia divergens]|uniref:RAVE complex protein Rav1 C-terminal domain-containing protein n=1 Tax=Babesia divergens TaxID=32595 RepID=A0AAD9GE75_BABDI|nr:hypothetical protein X943_003871 [Babesia divergens]
MKKAFLRGRQARRNALEVRRLDVLTVDIIPEGEHLRPAQLAAAVLCASSSGDSIADNVVCSVVYVYLVEYEDKVTHALTSRPIKCSANGCVCAAHTKMVRNSVPNQVWCLQHDCTVVSASWNRGSASKVNKLLVSIGRDMIAYVWRVGPSTSNEMLMHIDIGENTFGTSVSACWIDMSIDMVDSLFDDKDFIIFYETAVTSQGAMGDCIHNAAVPTRNGTIDHLEGHPNGNGAPEKNCNASEQRFKIFSIQGVRTLDRNMNVECVLSHLDIELPMQLRRLNSAKLCSHTLETGLITVYASDTMRPTKVSARNCFRMSRWITLTSSTVKAEISAECHDGLLGAQLICGLQKFVPPCILSAVNDIGLEVQISLTPCDIFLKDWDPTGGDNVIGLVSRYMCHVSTPFFVPRITPMGDAVGCQDVEDSIIERYRCMDGVRDVVSFYENGCFVVFVLYCAGRMEVFRTFTNNPAFGCTKDLRIQNVAQISAVKVHKGANNIFVMMFVIDTKGATRCNIYSWDAATISVVASWPFHPVPKDVDVILKFDLWYEGGPMYLVSPCLLAGSSDTGADGATHVYLINGKEIKHWLRISDGYGHDFITNSTLQLPSEAVGAKYSLNGDRLLCHLDGGRVIPVALVWGSNGPATAFPIYHPRYIKAFLELGLRRFVDEFIYRLVEVFRTLLSKLSEPDMCNVRNTKHEICDCIIMKTEHMHLFADLNRSFSLQLLRTFAGLIGSDMSHLLGEPMKVAFKSADRNQEIPIKECILYLQHVRLPGILWRDQIDLMDLFETLLPKAGSEDFMVNNMVQKYTTCGVNKASNFFMFTEAQNSKDFDIDETIDFRLTTEEEVMEEGSEMNAGVTCPLIYRAQSLLNRGKAELTTKVDRTNDNLVSLTLPPKVVTDEFCLGRFLDYIKYDFGNDEYLVWAILYKDDLNLFSSVLSMIDTGDDMVLCTRLLQNMPKLGLGYWVQSAACLDKLCVTVEKSFRKLIAVTEPGGNVEVFDELGFWSIMRNKPLVYGCVLKAKGFQRLGEFLSNDFTTERWKQVAVKNAYALIAQKRYLLAAGFLVLAGLVSDAVDVCFQYMDDPQLACLICRLRQHDLSYVTKLMQPSRIRDILCYKLGLSGIGPIEVNTAEELVYYLYTGIRYQHVTEGVMMETTRNCAAKYGGMGLPLVSLILNSLIEADSADRWKVLVSQSTLKCLNGKVDNSGALMQDNMRILQDFCQESIQRNISNMSNYGSDIGVGKVISWMDVLSNSDLNRSSDTVNSSEDSDDSVGRLEEDGFQLYLINALCHVKKRLGLDVTVGFGVEKVSFDHGVFEAVSRMHDYFSQLCKICIGFFEGHAYLDGNLLLALILRAIMEERNDLPSCLILSVASLLALICFDRGVTGQIYDALLGQLVMLNNLLNNQGSGDQFVTCLLRLVEPLCFGSPGNTVEPQCINLLRYFESCQKHAFFGICIGTAMLEVLVSLCRNWVFKFAESAETAVLLWVDRITISASRFIFADIKRQTLDKALNSTGIVFPMLSLRVGLESPVDCKVKDEECHVYDSFLEKYVASVYGSEFEKLWRLLHCGFRTSNLLTRHRHPGRANDHDTGICISGVDLERHGQVADTSSKALPLIIPVACIFSNAQMWTGEYVAAQATNQDRVRHAGSCPGESAVLDALRMKCFNALHMFKGRLLSTFHSLPSTTSYDGINGLTARSIVEPVMTDLYMMVMLNLRGSGKLSQLSEEFIRTVVNDVFAAVANNVIAARTYLLYVKFVRIISTYCKNHLDNMFGIKKVSRMTQLAEKLFKRFRVSTETKDHVAGGPSGGICGHPRWPIYAVVYGENPADRLPAYNVSLEHSAILVNDTQSGSNDSDSAYNGKFVYNSITGTHMNIGQGSVFGDLCSVGWAGDSLAVMDKNGWLLVYYMKNMIYVNGDDADIAIPAVSFRAHATATAASWISESYVVTIGNGIMQEEISPNVSVLDVKDDLSTKMSSSISTMPTHIHQEFDSMPPFRNEQDHMIRGVCDMKIPCVCIWDLVDFSRNNVPKLKVLIANSSNMPHSIFNKKKHSTSTTTFTCALPIPPMEMDGSPNSEICHDIIIFDSLGMMMFFSGGSQEITMTFKAHSCAVIKCFYVRGRVVTVAQDGTVGMFMLNGANSEPTRVFEGAACPDTSAQDSGSSDNLVTSIGQYLGIKFVDNSAKGTPVGAPPLLPEILDAQIVQDRFLVLTTVNGAVTVTKLPC